MKPMNNKAVMNTADASAKRGTAAPCRAVTPLASTIVSGMTCGAIETPGSIVLMPAG